jgi:hypothetical protein
VRTVLYEVEGDSDVLFDFPAAGGDTATVLGKLDAAIPAAEAPEGLVLPEGARLLRNDNLASSIFIPRGERIALVPLSAFEHGIRDTDGALALLDAAASVPAEGVLAIAVDFDGVRTCVSTAREGSSGAKLRDILSNPDFPMRAFALGLGLDGTYRFRSDFSAELVPATPHARLAATIGAPASPLANAILFPDAVAAASVRQATSIFTDDELRDFFSRQYASNFFGASLTLGDDETPVPDGVRDALAPAYTAFFRLIGDEYAAVFLPSEEGDKAGSAGILVFPANPQEVLDGLSDRFNDAFSGLTEALRDGGELEGDGPRIRIDPAGERVVQEIPVRSYHLRIDDAGDGTARAIGAFDAAAVGPALYIGTLPEIRLAGVLADLAAGATLKGPVATMPAFEEAYGEAPADASCGFLRLGMLFRSILPRLEALANAVDEDGIDFGGVLADAAIPDITLAITQRWISGGDRLDTVVSMPLADIHAIVDSIVEAQRRACTTALAGNGIVYDEEVGEDDGDAPSDE